MNKLFLLVLPIVSLLLTGCNNHSDTDQESIDPRDTVVVPEGITGEDSIAYIENTIIKSPISVDDLLGLAEVHTVEEMVAHYNDFEKAEQCPKEAFHFLATAHDSAAMRLANRVMRMFHLVDLNGNAEDYLHWATAVDTTLNTFCKETHCVKTDSTLYEIDSVISKFASWTQVEMNFYSYVTSTIEYYRTLKAYQELIKSAPKEIKSLIMDEYKAWHALNEARFNFWSDVSFRQEWYSMKPMEINSYYGYLSVIRRAELTTERDIIVNGKTYAQKGKTVTGAQWEEWIKDHSKPEDIELLQELKMYKYIPEDSVVVNRTNTLRSTFSHWIETRQAITAALSKSQAQSYDKLTADIHSRMIGTLPDNYPMKLWE